MPGVGEIGAAGVCGSKTPEYTKFFTNQYSVHASYIKPAQPTIKSLTTAAGLRICTVEPIAPITGPAHVRQANDPRRAEAHRSQER